VFQELANQDDAFAVANRFDQLLSSLAAQLRLQDIVKVLFAEEVEAIAADAPKQCVQETRGKRADRKSTRLNSSHQIISYAVFCFPAPAHISTLSLHDALPICFPGAGQPGRRVRRCEPLRSTSQQPRRAIAASGHSESTLRRGGRGDRG